MIMRESHWASSTATATFPVDGHVRDHLYGHGHGHDDDHAHDPWQNVDHLPLTSRHDDGD